MRRRRYLENVLENCNCTFCLRCFISPDEVFRKKRKGVQAIQRGRRRKREGPSAAPFKEPVLEKGTAAQKGGKKK